MILGLSLALLVIILDQLSKYVVMNIILGDLIGINYTSFFNLVKAWNKGVSFSMFDNASPYGPYILAAVSIVIVIFLLSWLRKENDKMLQVAIGFIIGGAIGNVIDRFRFGAVFDFLDVFYKNYHWPAFNVADSFICIGATMVVVHSLFFDKKKI